MIITVLKQNISFDKILGPSVFTFFSYEAFIPWSNSIESLDVESYFGHTVALLPWTGSTHIFFPRYMKIDDSVQNC